MTRSVASKAASAFGALGGSVRSEAKASAARANGALGGRPSTYRDAEGQPVKVSEYVVLATDGWSYVGGSRSYTQRKSAIRAAAKLYGWQKV